ncbi:MAG: bifunctional heptose 7-phosphate kinase/heptose 1-phosphate adenyltransferase [Gemmatimonadota bacterium]|jgi:D-beta-D-heptose 7-phosphate kinase/D-beta-D-heptose 1-phosphate adenosyltransferase
MSRRPALTPEHLVTRFAHAPRVRVAVVGDAMLDVYLRGDVERISPEAPVPVLRVRDRRDALGGAANVVQNVLALGSRCELVAAIGRDRTGERLAQLLGDAGTEPRGLVATDRPTTTKTRLVARSQQLLRYDEEDDGDLAGADVAAVIAAVECAVADADALVFEDYNKGVLVPSVIAAGMHAARAKGIPVVVDPKFRNFFAFQGATVFKPNRRELEQALGATVDLDHPDAMPEALARLGAEHLLLTLSERGMALFGRDGTTVRIPTRAREVFDVVGAGDTVTAWLAVMLACGASVAEAAEVANYAAGVQVGKFGAASVAPDEVLAAVARDHA